MPIVVLSLRQTGVDGVYTHIHIHCIVRQYWLNNSYNDY